MDLGVVLDSSKVRKNELIDVSESKKKDTNFYVIRYTMDKKTLSIYPALKEVVEAFNKRLKELLTPHLLQKSVCDIYFRSNLTFGHTEYPAYKYEFTMIHNNKKHVIYVEAKDLLRLIIKMAKNVCVNNMYTHGVVNNSENIYIQFREKYRWFWKLMGCNAQENNEKVVTYIYNNLDVVPVKEIYNFNSTTIGESIIAISHYEKMKGAEKKIETDGISGAPKVGREIPNKPSQDE
jgi:hypothetical protein